MDSNVFFCFFFFLRNGGLMGISSPSIFQERSWTWSRATRLVTGWPRPRFAGLSRRSGFLEMAGEEQTYHVLGGSGRCGLEALDEFCF